MDKERIPWIDSLKGIGIVLVVFAHLAPSMAIEKYIYSFHMFLFFFLSGYLFQVNHSFDKARFVSKTAIHLLIPYVFWSILSLITDMISGKGLLYSLSLFFMLDGTISWNAPIWFLWILFITECLYFLTYRYFAGKKYMILYPSVCLLVSYCLRNNYPLKLGIVPMALFFFWLGDNSVSFAYQLKTTSKKIVIVLLSSSVHIIFSQVNDRISVIASYYGRFYLCVLCGVSGCICYLIFFQGIIPDLCKRIRITSGIGKESMFIMCFHYPLLTIASYLSQRITGIDIWHYRSTTKAFFVTIFVIVICNYTIIILKSKCSLRFLRIIGIQ